MSDTTTVTAPKKASIAQTERKPLYNRPITVVRNDVPLSLSWTPFKRGDRKESGENYLGVTVTEDTLSTYESWYGRDNVVAVLNAEFAVSSQKIMDSVFKELEKLELSVGSEEWVNKFEERYTQYMTSLTTRGETIAALRAANEKIAEELGTIGVQASELLESGDVVNATELMKRMKSLKQAMLKNNEAIETKKRKSEGDDEDDETSVASTREPVNA